MLAGLSSREICTWYFMPPRSRYAPSVVPWSVSASLLPQALIARAATRATRATIGRRIGRGSLPPGPPERRRASAPERRAGRGLARAAGDRRALAAAVVLLEDRLQPAHGLAVLALRPAAGDALEEAVARELRLALVGEAHARAAAGGALELVDADRPVAVVLAGPPHHDDAART